MRKQYLTLLIIALLTGCHSQKRPEGTSFEPSTVWPLSKHTVWLDTADKTLVAAKDWHALLLQSQKYSPLHRDIILVEANHNVQDLEHEAQALHRLIHQHHWLHARDAFMVLARHSTQKLEACRTDPLVEIAYINRVYASMDWVKVIEKTCQNGNTYACGSMEEKLSKKLVLLLPLKGQLASSARAFRQGFMAAMLQDKARMDIETIDTSSEDMRSIERRLKEIEPDWVIGPMEKKWIQKLQRKRLPYPMVLLGECDSPLAKHVYCFSIASSAEVSLWTSRFQALGINDVWLVSDTKEWYQKWAKVFSEQARLKLTVETVQDYALWKDQVRHRLKDVQGISQDDLERRAIIFNMPTERAREIENYLAYDALGFGVTAAPSIVAELGKQLNVQYYTMPILVRNNPEHIPQTWIDLTDMLGKDRKTLRFKAWGMDTYAYVRSGTQDRLKISETLPLEGATGVSYVQRNRVMRSMDLVEARS